ncbi:MAG: hypothetical protein E5W60_24350, partial [Mesorhizobium sp.]
MPDHARFFCFKPVTRAAIAYHPSVTGCGYIRFIAKRKTMKGIAMFTKVQTANNRLQAPERNDRRPKLALRQRASDHPMAMFMAIGALA